VGLAAATVPAVQELHLDQAVPMQSTDLVISVMAAVPGSVLVAAVAADRTVVDQVPLVAAEKGDFEEPE